MVIAFLFWLISLIAPPIVGEIIIPGVNVGAGQLIWITAMLVMIIFLIRAMADALVLADIVTDVIVRRLGIKEERSLKRAARDAIYIIIAILLAAAALPFLASVPRIGGLLATAVSIMALGFFILLMYDIGRILYRVLEERAETVAEWLVEAVERVREKKKR